MHNAPRPLSVTVLLLSLLGGCTVHPQGEQEERSAALHAGKPFEKPVSERTAPPLPENPTADDLVRYACLTNADLEQRYWEWRAAIEQVTQDGTQPTNLSISASSMISKGRLSWDRTSVTVGNDPMADIVWPDKLSMAAQRSLENARAAGIRFQKARYELRARVIAAFDDYALNAKLIQIEASVVELLAATATNIEGRNRVGSAGQQEVLRSENETDLARNELAMLKSQTPALRAALNALLGREAGASLPMSPGLPAMRNLAGSDEQVLALVAEHNPELRALAAEIRGKQDGVRLARLQYLPDFSLSTGTDLAGLSQTLLAAATVPVLRHEAIGAAIAQAEANVRAAEAMRRKNKNDVTAQVMGDVLFIHDADRQLKLINELILPRLGQVVTLTRSAYESGRSSLLDLLDSQRSMIAIERLAANLQTTRNNRLASLEAIAGRSLAADLPATDPAKPPPG